MAAIPPPIKTPPANARRNSVLRWLTTKMATAEANTAGRRDINTVGQSYSTGTGKLKASIPV